MQDKFQFKLNPAIHGDDADTIYTAVLDGGCYLVTWDDMDGPTPSMFGAVAVESIIERGSWLVQ